jgi:hypothetical protein
MLMEAFMQNGYKGKELRELNKRSTFNALLTSRTSPTVQATKSLQQQSSVTDQH